MAGGEDTNPNDALRKIINGIESPATINLIEARNEMKELIENDVQYHHPEAQLDFLKWMASDEQIYAILDVGAPHPMQEMIFESITRLADFTTKSYPIETLQILGNAVISMYSVAEIQKDDILKDFLQKQELFVENAIGYKIPSNLAYPHPDEFLKKTSGGKIAEKMMAAFPAAYALEPQNSFVFLRQALSDCVTEYDVIEKRGENVEYVQKSELTHPQITETIIETARGIVEAELSRPNPLLNLHDCEFTLTVMKYMIEDLKPDLAERLDTAIARIKDEAPRSDFLYSMQQDASERRDKEEQFFMQYVWDSEKKGQLDYKEIKKNWNSDPELRQKWVEIMAERQCEHADDFLQEPANSRDQLRKPPITPTKLGEGRSDINESHNL